MEGSHGEIKNTIMISRYSKPKHFYYNIVSPIGAIPVMVLGIPVRKKAMFMPYFKKLQINVAHKVCIVFKNVWYQNDF